MAKHDRLVKVALLVARHSTHPKFRIGALIAQGPNIISTGTNKLKTHPSQINPYTGQYGCSIHAELDAIIGISRERLKGSTIYVVRLLANNHQGLARPCKSCRTMIEELGIDRIIYTTSDSFKIEKVMR